MKTNKGLLNKNTFVFFWQINCSIVEIRRSMNPRVLFTIKGNLCGNLKKKKVDFISPTTYTCLASIFLQTVLHT